MAVSLSGAWKIRVVLKNAGWSQRFVIAGSVASNGAHAGVVGAQVHADGANWSIQVQARDGGPWLDSDMRIGPEVPSGISVTRLIETNDQGGADTDFDDLVLEARKKQEPIIDIVQRPYAVNPASLHMNPDGVFLARGGIQLMGVRVRNTWTQAMPADQVLDISTTGRMQLAAAGIAVVDAWSPRELEAVGQQMVASRMPVIGPLQVGEERTVYFKLDCSAARTSTPLVEFIARRIAPEPDLDDPARLARRKIFVTEVRYDPIAREVIASVPEGRLRLQIQAITLDPALYNEARRCMRRIVTRDRRRARSIRELLQKLIRDLERGHCDPCALLQILDLCCRDAGHPPGGGDGCRDGDCEGGDNSGGVNPCPFPWLPLKLSYTVEAPFDGKFGPLPFQDPWWKILAAIIAILLLIAAALVDILDEAHENPNNTIGTVGNFSTANVDAALINLNGSRSFDLGVLDAQSGEPNQNPRIALGAVVPLDRSAVAAPFVGMRVYKSGARTGFTHGIVTSINATTNQCRGDWDDATSTCTPDPDRPNLVMNNQIRIAVDPAFPGEPTTDGGDSGSLWISNEPATQDQVVGLTHSGSTTSDANPIADVLSAMQVRLNP